MYEICTIKESYPALEKTEIIDTTPLKQSPTKVPSLRMTASIFQCKKINRDVFLILESALGTGTSISFLDTRISSKQSAETINLVNPDLIQGVLQIQLAMLLLKNQNYSFETSINLNKKVFTVSFIILQVLIFHFLQIAFELALI